MAITVPRSLVEFILLGPEDDRRQLQDSPILGDVWVEFAKAPDQPLELLITPYKDNAAAVVAAALAAEDKLDDASVAYLQGIVAAKLRFDEVLRYVVPMTDWWVGRKTGDKIIAYFADKKTLFRDLKEVLDAARAWADKNRDIAVSLSDLGPRIRYIALAGIIVWAASQRADGSRASSASSEDLLKRILATANLEKEIAESLLGVYQAKELGGKKEGLVWTVSLNRRATPAVVRSVPAVKADAARTLFSVDCSDICWAVIDSGIDASHPAFEDKKNGGQRIARCFDFTRIRRIISLDNLREDSEKRAKLVADLAATKLVHLKSRATITATLKELAVRARDSKAIDWERIETLVEIDPRTEPPSNHGTHVAGILGAGIPSVPGAKVARKGARKSAKEAAADITQIYPDAALGMCPDIKIYDFRVLAPTIMETEFAIIAALQYIRYVNERNSWFTIHGANSSLSIPHDVRNYACGRTPICNECERLVGSGVSVVAAAGNRGYQNFETKEGLFESYAAFSVTDPGNADGVITVGATHRYWPHTYGVSFFSSRGPTGDGRAKPDLVAPGERIRAPLPNEQWGDLDGTSMAAPHVSGAAAMLMARYTELIGRPRRIKDILCESATDLGRERSFQGHGMLDVLRAFQNVEEAAMIFSLDVRRARKGDCLLLHFGTKQKPGLVLIDGGPKSVYVPHSTENRADPQSTQTRGTSAAAGRSVDGEPRR